MAANGFLFTTPLKGKLGWIAMILVVAVWMFVLGIMVGRSTAPMDRINQSIQEKLAQLKAAPPEEKQETPGVAGEQETGISVTDLNFYEKLKETEPVPPPKMPSVKPLKPVPPAPPKTQSAPAAPPEKKTVPETSAPPSAPKPVQAPKADTPPPPTDGGHFTIQVAAVKNFQGATKLVDQLRQEGFDAYQMSTKADNGETWYRVRVGAFKNQSEAQPTLSRLSKMNFNGMVLQTP